MSLEDPGSVSFAGIGGLGEQVRELREVIELPLMNPELFEVGLAAGPLGDTRSWLMMCSESWNQTTQGSPALWTARYRYGFPHLFLYFLTLCLRQNAARTSGSRDSEYQLSQSRVLGRQSGSSILGYSG